MSTRTLIEINHDQLNFLLDEHQQVFPQLLHALRSGEGPMWVGRSFVSGDGIRILGQRHHGDEAWSPSWSTCSCRTIAQASTCKFAGTCESARDVVRMERDARAHAGHSDQSMYRMTRSEQTATEVMAATDAIRRSAATSLRISMMAAAILGQPPGTMDNRHPYWPQAVEQAARAYDALASVKEA